MPVIRIACVGDDPESANYAAAIMGTTLAKASEPIPHLSAKGEITKPEKTRPKNPNQLTVKQHVFPVRSMQQFVDKRGCVSVVDMLRGKLRPARPKDIFFCAQRAWDERTEAFMKHIEDKFQKIVQPIIAGRVNTIAPGQKPAIDSMFALWFMRTRYRRLDAQEIQLFGVLGGDVFTKTEEENLEKNGYLFARMGGKVPARQLNGVQLQMRVSHYARDLAALTGWGVIHAQSGEFIVPDVPTHTIIPLSPKLALAASSPDGIILEQNLAEINSALKAGSREYYFSRDLSKCPFSA
jgi:hypothetical protein